MRYFICFIFLISAATPVFSQAIPPPDKPDADTRQVYGIGLSLGLTSGFGLSFRHHLPGTFSYQIVGGVIKADRNTLGNIGGEMQFDFVKTARTRFFGVAAIGYFYKGEDENSLAGPFRAGAGIGLEYQQFRSISVTGEILFTIFNDGDIVPLPQISMHYYFF